MMNKDNIKTEFYKHLQYIKDEPLKKYIAKHFEERHKVLTQGFAPWVNKNPNMPNPFIAPVVTAHIRASEHPRSMYHKSNLPLAEDSKTLPIEDSKTQAVKQPNFLQNIVNKFKRHIV
jgi:hypothetical protein